MRNKWAHPYHLGLESLHIDKVANYVLSCLKRRTYHNAAACLKTYLFKVGKTEQPVGKAQCSRVQLCIMSLGCCFVAKQISVRAGAEIFLIRLLILFAQRKRQSAIWELCFYISYHFYKHIIGKVHILPALEDKSPKSYGIAIFTALHYFTFRKAVSCNTFVAFSYAAVVTIISAIICKLYKTSEINLFSKNRY